MHVLLDLYGVLLDHEKMFRGYRDHLAQLFAARCGGEPDAWRRAHDDAFVTYAQRVDEADWDARGYTGVVDELDAQLVLDMFDRVGVRNRPADPLALSRDLEREAMAQVNARYPDARSAIERLRSAGHKVYVATGGGDTNEAALRGAGLLDLIDGMFTGDTQNAQKSRPLYWSGIPRRLGVVPADCVLVDDRLDYLEAAASEGILALLLDRKGAHRPETMPSFVQATLRNLAGLPHWVEVRTSEGKR
jgi:HAD superfamily hydrolase (TIGR01509 family)